LDLRTIAGNIDPEAVNRFHKATPLTGSLDPIAEISKLKNLPQHHWIGSADTIIPLSVVQNFAKKIGDSSCIKVSVFPGVTHNHGWEDHWSKLVLAPPEVC